MTIVSRFSRQYDAGLRTLAVILRENLVIVLESKDLQLPAHTIHSSLIPVRQILYRAIFNSLSLLVFIGHFDFPCGLPL